MTPDEIARMLERYATSVERLPGVSRRNPDIFAEEKSELAGAMRREAKELRTVPRRAAAPVVPAAIRRGTVRVAGREIRVETRRRA